MVYFSIICLCNLALFMTLLEDRFKLWTTVSVCVVSYVTSLIVQNILGAFFEDTAAYNIAAEIANVFIIYLMSLFIFKNNFLQKLLLALFCIANFGFINLFNELMLGIMPFGTAGAFAGVFSVFSWLLLTLFCVLLLYRFFHFFSSRYPSTLEPGLVLALLLLYGFSVGWFDFLFRTNVFAARFIICFIIYTAVFFTVRAAYHAAKYKESEALIAERRRMTDMRARDFSDMLSGVREVRAAKMSGEYALDTIDNMVKDGDADKVPKYISGIKFSGSMNPMLKTYDENPYINAVIATKAAFAEQNDIRFAANVNFGNPHLKTSELCLIINELLTKACAEAAEYSGERRVRLTVFPTESALSFELVFSSAQSLPAEEKKSKPRRFYSIKSRFESLKSEGLAKVVSEFFRSFVNKESLHGLLSYMFEDLPENPATSDLDCTEEIISIYSGSLNVSGAGDDTIIHVKVNY